MNMKTLISSLALTTLLGTAIALPATASAHEVVKEKRVTVIKKTERQDVRRHGDVDRWYVERHREVTRSWEPSRYSYRNERGYGHKYGHRNERHDYRDYRPVEHHRDYDRHNDGVRVRIDYDFWL